MFIYGLCDPRDGQLRYVGKTRGSIVKRLRKHMLEARSKKVGHKNRWISQLVSIGLKPDAFCIEEAIGDGREEEIHHIAQFKSIGCRLTNMTLGGEGMLGYVASCETRAKISSSKKGKQRSQETKDKIRASLIGHSVSELTRQKIAKANLGKVLSTKTRDRMKVSREKFLSS